MRRKIALHKKPSIRAQICLNTDWRTPRITGCSDVFDYGWLKIFHYNPACFFRIQLEYSKCSISHTGHVLVDLCYIKFFLRNSDHLWLEHFGTLPDVQEFATWRSLNTYGCVKYHFRQSHAMNTTVVSSRTDFLQVICASAKYSRRTCYMFRNTRFVWSMKHVHIRILMHTWGIKVF